MPPSEYADTSPFAYRRFRRILQIGIAIMLLFCVLSFSELMSRPQLVEALSAIVDTIFTLVLIAATLQEGIAIAARGSGGTGRVGAAEGED